MGTMRTVYLILSLLLISSVTVHGFLLKNPARSRSSASEAEPAADDLPSPESSRCPNDSSECPRLCKNAVNSSSSSSSSEEDDDNVTGKCSGDGRKCKCTRKSKAEMKKGGNDPVIGKVGGMLGRRR